MDNYTGGNAEGIGYVEINMPEGFSITDFTGAVVTASGSGRSFDLRRERRFTRALARGIATSLTNANLVANFFMLPRHTSGASATFERYYLIGYLGTNAHVGFMDANGTQQSYCKGITIACTRQWNPGNDPINWLLRINWESVWS
ncbi:hypothetical protein LCGC14_0697240 [marine sediment metagenome]|uniref:Uncharacterized protein n=2 Tax=marine sediment metagenome TaxID=412755 RepID=A0A0F9QNL6_9ZZZZ